MRKSSKAARAKKSAKPAFRHKEGCDGTCEKVMPIAAGVVDGILLSVALQAPDIGLQAAVLGEAMAMLTASVARSLGKLDPEIQKNFLELINVRLGHHFQKAGVDATLALRT